MNSDKEKFEKQYYSYVLKAFVLSMLGLITSLVSGYMVYHLFKTASEDDFIKGAILIVPITLVFVIFARWQINRYKKNMHDIAVELKRMGVDLPEI